ncbi:MAG: YceI family protein [Maricaulaceae bacterium]|nr:YceI family protein [Maricaulaceae bacterium]
MIRLALAAALAAAPAAQAQDWTVDHESSRVGFETEALGTAVSGQFREFDAGIRFDPDDLESAVIRAVVRVGSVATGSSQTDGALTDRSGFHPSQFPEAVFVSERVERDGEGYVAHGALTIRGESRDIALPFALTIDGGRAVAQGGFEIDRADFGIGGRSWGDAARHVRVLLHIEADRAH